MKTHAREWAAMQNSGRFLFCSKADGVAMQLGKALENYGVLMQEQPPLEVLGRRLAEIGPKVVFIDFTPDDGEPGKLLHAADMARMLARVAPGIPRVAVGSLSHPNSAIAALRAGVSDFIDPGSPAEEVREVVERAMGGALTLTPSGSAPKRSVVLLSARPGVGASTLAVHLAALIQQRIVEKLNERLGNRSRKSLDPADFALADRVALLDLGWPVADCLLYLGTSGDFDYAEAVRNLRRLDPTLLGSAMAHSRSGIAALPMPREMGEMRDVTLADSLLLYERMRQHYGAVVADVGGFANSEFVAGLARATQETWVIADQSVGALVSLNTLLEDLERHHVPRSQLKLVVSRYDQRYGMDAAQIAERFRLELAGTLPERTQALMTCTGQGRLLHEVAERDPYVRSVQQLADKLMAEVSGGAARGSWLSTWLPNVQKRLS
jgi:pilus assembly protein CpaE